MNYPDWQFSLVFFTIPYLFSTNYGTFLGGSPAFLYHSLFMLRGVHPMARLVIYNTCIV